VPLAEREFPGALTVNKELSAMIFINNKYSKYYFSIINHANNRTLSKDTYSEVHHIIPEALNGTDSADNLVTLTAKEHYVCHHLLCRMTTDIAKQKMCGAFLMMSVFNDEQKRYSKKISANEYAKLKKEFAAYNSLITKERNAKLTADERKELYGRGGKDNQFYARTHSIQSLAQMRDSHKKQRALLSKCPHCGVECDAQNYAKYHGDKCDDENKGVAGRKWYHLSTKSFYLYPNDAKIVELELTHGRAKNKNLGRKKQVKA
jgi:hypothetical protein